MKRFVVGDIHGNYKGLKQALEKAGFNYEEDLLISIGDIADGHQEVPEVIEEFMKMKNLIWCVGNHDVWCQDWMSGKTDMKNVGIDGYAPKMSAYISADADMWLSQGGRATFKAYMGKPELISKHRDFWLTKPVLYHETEDNKLFLHAGYSKVHGIDYTAQRYKHLIYWDRNFWTDAMRNGDDNDISHYDKVYIGHTSVTYWGFTTPQYRGKVWNMDTGGGWDGYISVMNIDTEEIFQSDEAIVLYPGFKPRQ